MWNFSVKHRLLADVTVRRCSILDLPSDVESAVLVFQIPDVLGQLSRCGVLFMAEVRSVFVVALLECGSSVSVLLCVCVLVCVCVWCVSEIKRVLVSARPAPTASASEIARPCIHSRDYSSRYRIITPLST